MSEAARIDVCVCTYNRPEKLKECIHSIINQELLDFIKLRVIVVDNSLEQTGRNITEIISGSTAVPIIYINETRRGISYARNKCLDSIDADYFCFIDDDEIASAHWIINLYQTLKNYDADITSGPVIATYPENTPFWVIESKVFERPRISTGEIPKSVATGNCIIKTSIIQKTGVRFDNRFALSGGEDSDFFSRLILSGYKAVYCNEAEVYEEADLSRMNLIFWIKRAVRGGQTYSIIKYSSAGKLKKIMLTAKQLLNLIITFLIMLVCIPFGRKHYIRWLIKSSASIGQITGLYGMLMDIY